MNKQSQKLPTWKVHKVLKISQKQCLVLQPNRFNQNPKLKKKRKKTNKLKHRRRLKWLQRLKLSQKKLRGQRWTPDLSSTNSDKLLPPSSQLSAVT